jgi:hypothetical protein
MGRAGMLCVAPRGRPVPRRGAEGRYVEALLFMVDCAVIVVMVYMGLRDDRRSARAPATSLFRTRDRAGAAQTGLPRGQNAPEGLMPMPFQPLR